MWEVDPETKSKLLALQKLVPNSTCVDCSAPSPQWASPKFGTFICLSCAGVHRGLGVHISFVRSISMDSFKKGEVKRMESGGNKRWKEFWEAHVEGGNGQNGAWEKSTIEERYSGTVGEEWKERLSAEIEGREYVPPPVVKKEKKIETGPSSRSETPLRTDAQASSLGGKKEKNEAYFAKLGNENANRSADLPPSQGGKYAGFGSGGGIVGGMPVPNRDEGIPGVDEFQKDPVAALTKGFGWFTSTVGKGAKTVNEGWIQPGVQKLAEADIATQARLTAQTVASGVQKGTKGAADQFSRFVEGTSDEGGSSSRSAAEPEKKDFWDSFGAPESSAGERKPLTGAAKKSSTIGTSAMKGSASEKQEWGDDQWDKF